MNTSFIALAGIAATAIVGISGTTGSWLISKDDRANQRALAHDARVFDRRAEAYVDALAVMEPLKRLLQRFSLHLEPGRRRDGEYRRDLDDLARAVDKLEIQRPAVLAFGSAEANRLYSNARLNAHNAVFWAGDFDGGAYGGVVDLYENEVRFFERVVQQELG